MSRSQHFTAPMQQQFDRFAVSGQRRNIGTVVQPDRNIRACPKNPTRAGKGNAFACPSNRPYMGYVDRHLLQVGEQGKIPLRFC
ncbi:MAG: hypothetical protein ACUVSY_18545, partial [Roseiflexus sp.]